jgi:PIN domain nuclease of toxin-antitoxin system
MKLLLDTHAAIWFLNGDERLSETAKRAILDPLRQKFVSMASVWEIAIKISLQKLTFAGNVRGFLDLIAANGFDLLQINIDHILELEKLAFFHRDPFDRLLISTAIAEDMHIVSVDSNFKLYPVNRVW